jgi:hypothetical protein
MEEPAPDDNEKSLMMRWKETLKEKRSQGCFIYPFLGNIPTPDGKEREPISRTPWPASATRPRRNNSRTTWNLSSNATKTRQTRAIGSEWHGTIEF